MVPASGPWEDVYSSSPAAPPPSGSEPSSELAAGGPAGHPELAAGGPAGHTQATSGLVKWLEVRDGERQPDYVGNEVLEMVDNDQGLCTMVLFRSKKGGR